MEIRQINDMKLERAKHVTDIQKLNEEMRTVSDPIKLGERAKMEVAFDEINDKVNAEERNLERQRALGETSNETPKDNTEERQMRAFENYIRTGSVKELRDLSVGTSYSGIELIPTILSKAIIGKMKDIGAMRKLATIMTSNADTNIPVENAAATGYWVAEAGAITVSSPTFATISLKSNKLGAIVKVSNELLNDSAFDVPNYLTNQFAEQFAIMGEDQYINGTLSGRPTGIAGKATFALTSSLSSSVAVADVMSLYTAPIAQYRENGSWLVADNLLSTLMIMGDTNYHNLYQPSATAGVPDRFVGKPIFTSAKVTAAATTTKSMYFGDFSKYVIMDRIPLQLARLNELYAANDQTGFRGIARTDGNLLQAIAIYYMACK